MSHHPHRTIALIALTALQIAVLPVAAQQTRSLSPDVCTVRTLLNGKPGLLPVISLGGGDRLEVSFDDMTHEYERFEYRLIHCDRDWQPSEGILTSDAVDYTQESIPVEDYAYSFNTTQLYTHYRFEIPSADARPRLSGNYRVQISRDGDYDDELVAEVCFMVTERSVGVGLRVSDDTEVDWRQAHQQVVMSVDYGNMKPLPSNPREELTTVVLQNRRWDNARHAVQPDYTPGRSLSWEHCRELVFAAGNEYRRFENTTTRHAAMGMESLRWYDPYYHAQLRMAQPRRNYVFERDQNGLNVVRSVDGDLTESDIQADYMLVHFELQMAPLPAGQRIYVQGQWTSDWLTPENEMHYDQERGIYECVMLLKQGYYNYQFLVTSDPTRPGQTGPVEGDFFQTENAYDVLVYYRNPFDRYDRLVGHAQTGKTE